MIITQRSKNNEQGNEIISDSIHTRIIKCKYNKKYVREVCFFKNFHSTIVLEFYHSAKLNFLSFKHGFILYLM